MWSLNNYYLYPNIRLICFLLSYFSDIYQLLTMYPLNAVYIMWNCVIFTCNNIIYIIYISIIKLLLFKHTITKLSIQMYNCTFIFVSIWPILYLCTYIFICNTQSYLMSKIIKPVCHNDNLFVFNAIYVYIQYTCTMFCVIQKRATFVCFRPLLFSFEIQYFFL